MSKFGQSHGSQKALSNLLLVTAQPKLPKRSKKAKISLGNVEFLGVSHQIFTYVEMSNLKKRSHVTPPVDLNGIPQYIGQVHFTDSSPGLPLAHILWEILGKHLRVQRLYRMQDGQSATKSCNDQQILMSEN